MIKRGINNRATGIAAAAFALLLAGVLYSCQDIIQSPGKAANQDEITVLQPQRRNEDYLELFRRHGSPNPALMAEAVQVAKPCNRPVLAAMAVVESRADHKAVGDGGRSRGAWQVQQQFWGKVPDTAVAQVLQAERILEELLATRTLPVALAAYNGGNTPNRQAKRYASEVLAVAREVE